MRFLNLFKETGRRAIFLTVICSKFWIRYNFHGKGTKNKTKIIIRVFILISKCNNRIIFVNIKSYFFNGWIFKFRKNQ